MLATRFALLPDLATPIDLANSCNCLTFILLSDSSVSPSTFLMFSCISNSFSALRFKSLTFTPNKVARFVIALSPYWLIKSLTDNKSPLSLVNEKFSGIRFAGI